jgi:16S rRNA (adenine1518-N6/adenine1519-N6)-dimethyltransferase
VRALLDRHGLAAHRDRGQNFLCDEALAAKLVRTAGVGPEDTVIEIGTGLGILTRALAARAARVVTVEVDAGLVRALRAEATLPANVELVHADALAVDLAAWVAKAPGPVRVVANLPYSVATPLLRRLLDLRTGLASVSVLVQRELALRLTATTGSRDYGSFAVLHALTMEVRAGLDLHPRCFYPVPRVVSRFVHMTPRPDAPDDRAFRELERVVRGAFSHRRKTLANALRGSGVFTGKPAALAALLTRHGVDPRARAETVAPATWLALARELGAVAGEAP